MSTGVPSIFVDEMLTLAREGASLWEFPLPMSGRSRGGSVVPFRGPWDPARCGAVLVRWLDAGWVRCTASIGGVNGAGEFVRDAYVGEWTTRASVEDGFLILDHRDARSVLVAFGAWARGTDRNIQVEVCDEVSGRPDADWLALLEGLPEDWIYA